ncbi:uncharacterized protein LOC113363545 [Ctenocephalides felis]|uniref:uncharacterized protein LOC113363545 n=1 Tax=Ctenocephalides felis TaxID=7515 RepID=UPI000E6E1454|nr:uncharacterized protein LOC113363545 [Ctenocephalides felis]
MFVNFLFVNFLFVNAFVIDGYIMDELFKQTERNTRTNGKHLAEDKMLIDKINNNESDDYLTNNKKYELAEAVEDASSKSKDIVKNEELFIANLVNDIKFLNDMNIVHKFILLDKIIEKYSMNQRINEFNSDNNDLEKYENDNADLFEYQRNSNELYDNKIDLKNNALIYKNVGEDTSSQKSIFHDNNYVHSRNKFLLNAKIKKHRRRVSNSFINAVPLYNAGTRDIDKEKPDISASIQTTNESKIIEKNDGAFIYSSLTKKDNISMLSSDGNILVTNRTKITYPNLTLHNIHKRNVDDQKYLAKPQESSNNSTFTSKPKLKKQYCHSRDPETLTYFSPIAVEVTITSISTKNNKLNENDEFSSNWWTKNGFEYSLVRNRPMIYPAHRINSRGDRTNGIYSAVFRINKVLKDVYNKLEPNKYIKLQFLRKMKNSKKINCGYIFSQDFQKYYKDSEQGESRSMKNIRVDEHVGNITRPRRQIPEGANVFASRFETIHNPTRSQTNLEFYRNQRFISNHRNFNYTEHTQNQRRNFNFNSAPQAFVDKKMYSVTVLETEPEVRQPIANNQRFYKNSFQMKQDYIDFSEPITESKPSFNERSSKISENKRIYSSETNINRSKTNENRYTKKITKNRPNIYSSINEHDINKPDHSSERDTLILMNSELNSADKQLYTSFLKQSDSHVGSRPQPSLTTKRQSNFPKNEKFYLIEADLKLSKTYVLFMNHEISSRDYNVLSEPLLVTPKTMKSIQRALKTQYGKPAGIVPPVSSRETAANVGERRQIVCRTVGEPPPRVTWFKTGTAGRLRNAARKGQAKRNQSVKKRNENRSKSESGYRIIHQRYKSILEFQNLTQSDEGIYQCKIKNGKSTFVQNIKLTVKSRPPTLIPSHLEPSYSECPHQQFCLNGGTCMFFVRLAEPACKCQDGFTGQRCESKHVSLQRATNDCEFGTHFYC